MLIEEPPPGEERDGQYAADRDTYGYVWNYQRAWAWRPGLLADFVAVRSQLMEGSSLGDRDWAVMVTSMASELGDSYCSLAWGGKLAKLSDPETAAALLANGDALALNERERALAAWTRRLIADPNGTTEADVARLRAAGLDDRQIFEATAFVAFRLAFSTVNDALGVEPDLQLAESVPAEIRAAVSYGRPPAAEPSTA